MPMLDLAADLVELALCPSPIEESAPLREMVFRKDAWTPDELALARSLFAADETIETTAAAVGRGRAGVADKLHQLGLRRNSSRPWLELEDRLLVERYGKVPASRIALELGRSCGAVYGRAQLLDLSEENPPAYDLWEDAQLRAGYAQAVPVGQIATLIGRSLAGVASRACALGLRHPNHPADWSDAEISRALELAEQGCRYLQIIERLVSEGYPRRTKAGFGPKIRKLGYGRGWGRAWSPEEDALLRRAYGTGASLTPLRTILGRTRHSIKWRAEYLGLQGTHVKQAGWRTDPIWSEADLALLRAEYGKTPSPELARKLGRTKPAMFTRAFNLGLVHGYIRPYSPEETRAMDIAFRNGIAIADLALALDRKAVTVSKHATNHGYQFGRRPRSATPPTIASILELERSAP